jgi:alanyl-tRNA synthetase/REP element-mobilizing transposase RayT
MTSSEIRQSFLDFFREKDHTILPSSSLLPDSPNLLFTNAGMNQFVPIFLGNRTPDVDHWPGAVSGSARRAADTQKCIRAGGKHNDLDDVGLDTYHHTFFEMLGNWSFGDYFKREAIEWAWELVVHRWKFPAARLYATVYKPDEGDPADFDQEAYNLWAKLFSDAGLDPQIQIVTGGKKDNFWMMGDTGPCGPCSEVHVDLTPQGDTRGSLVNRGDPHCIEIWNLVFIQFNANADGSFTALPARHVDTGMGFERVTSIIQCTKHFRDFSGAISNYETGIFRPIFDEIEKLSGKRYGSTLPSPGSTGETEQEKMDVAFRVIADHIRTLTFAIADGIQPSNEGRNYVLRRILRRAVRYGRVLGFQEPFFYKLVDVLVRTTGDVFLEIREKQTQVKETLKREEEAFNKTLDKGIALFHEYVANLGSARGTRASVGGPPTASSSPDAVKYSKRRLPHFERPWSKYEISWSTSDRRILTPDERQIVLACILHWKDRRYELYAACVMPDHVHLLLEPRIKEDRTTGTPEFFSLSEILHTIKSFTAHEINKLRQSSGAVWEKESFDRLIRSESDLQEKFHYITRNPWDGNVVNPNEDYPWVWYPEHSVFRPAAETSTPAACAPQISGDFAFKLYDTYGFPIDLTQLMARERGLSVDVVGFDKLMEAQRQRAREDHAQKKSVIALADTDRLGVEPTKFLGYDFLETEAVVESVTPAQNPDEMNVILDRTACYAEMGGQVGDRGVLHVPGPDWTEAGQLQIIDTQKKGDFFVHHAQLAAGRAPEPGEAIRVAVDAARRSAIQRHHTVTHLLHWALHEVVGRDATQKGSYVGPEKLTFDVSSAALTPQQVRDVEKLINERVVENAPVSSTEVSYSEVRSRVDIMQFFGEKYGERVRVVQIGGHAGALDGYSMELCAGTHTRATGEIGLFRIVSESGISAGVRRIEAIAGLGAYERAVQDAELMARLAQRVNTPLTDLERKIEALINQQKDLERQLRALQQKQAAGEAQALLRKAQLIGDVPAIVEHLAGASGEMLHTIVQAMQNDFRGVVLLFGSAGENVSMVAAVSREFVARISAQMLIQKVSGLVSGKGGGKPELARGAGKNAGGITGAIEAARQFIAAS